jgi:hypothetical protein
VLLFFGQLLCVVSLFSVSFSCSIVFAPNKIPVAFCLPVYVYRTFVCLAISLHIFSLCWVIQMPDDISLLVSFLEMGTFYHAISLLIFSLELGDFSFAISLHIFFLVLGDLLSLAISRLIFRLELGTFIMPYPFTSFSLCWVCQISSIIVRGSAAAYQKIVRCNSIANVVLSDPLSCYTPSHIFP